jgi:hypothetical protein
MYKKSPLAVWRDTRIKGRPIRTLLIRSGILLAMASGAYVATGMAGLAPLETEALAWNNIRIVSGLTILGCLMAAIGYGNE